MSNVFLFSTDLMNLALSNRVIYNEASSENVSHINGTLNVSMEILVIVLKRGRTSLYPFKTSDIKHRFTTIKICFQEN